MTESDVDQAEKKDKEWKDFEENFKMSHVLLPHYKEKIETAKDSINERRNLMM